MIRKEFKSIKLTLNAMVLVYLLL